MKSEMIKKIGRLRDFASTKSSIYNNRDTLIVQKKKEAKTILTDKKSRNEAFVFFRLSMLEMLSGPHRLYIVI